MTNATAEI